MRKQLKRLCPVTWPVMAKWCCVLMAAALVVTLVPVAPVQGAPDAYPLQRCERGAFSTEEDFMMTKGEPYDGDPYISDGDVLSLDGQVCARNQDLLASFFVGAVPPDLGLDALDILDVKDRIVAFSTEIDDPGGRFSEGDLLFTTGGIVPNAALVAAFNMKPNVGLDAVQMMGDHDDIVQFVNAVGKITRDQWLQNPGQLQTLLDRYKIDIWFSIEGTWGPPEKPTILDGDLLSAGGTVIATNAALLPASVPAGLPNRGVDYGLDAIQTARNADMEIALSMLAFSVEILRDEDPLFTDGDVLRYGDGILIPDADLVKPFAPAADFLGLDALSYRQPKPEPDPMITEIGDRSVWEIDGGVVPIGGAGTGLYSAVPGGNPKQPFGDYVPIDGWLPTGVAEYRIAFRGQGDPIPAPGAGNGISTRWKIKNWNSTLWACVTDAEFKDDGNGWFDYGNYLYHRNVESCLDSGLVLAVWDTTGDPNVADENGHYLVWLEWRETPGGPVLREPVEHHVQLDNKKPEIVNLELRTKAGVKVPPCGKTTGQDVFEVFAEFHDPYYWGYLLRVRGGAPPNHKDYGWHNYYAGTPPSANTNYQGTKPTGMKYLRDIDMNDLGASYVECCYVLDLWVRDRSIRHSFNLYKTNEYTPSWPNRFLTFAAAP